MIQSELNEFLSIFSEEAVFAVRSSATEEDGLEHSFAGIYTTQLNVDRKDVLDAVRDCRKSASSAAASAYQQETGVTRLAQPMPVLVQVMVPSKFSGVCFTVNPVTNATNEMLINAYPGFGEALVSGQVTPDEIIVDKRTEEISSASYADDVQGCLSKSQLQQVVSLAKRVESIYGAPQDIEWSFDDNQLWLLQARPITTLRNQNTSTEIEWTRANLIEIFPDVVDPLNTSLVEDVMSSSTEEYYGKLHGDVEQYGSWIKSFNGRLYLNLTQIKYMARLTGTSIENILESVGHHENVNVADAKPEALTIGERLKVLPTLLRIVYRQLRVIKDTRHACKLLKLQLAEIGQRDFSQLDDHSLVTLLQGFKEQGPSYVKITLSLAGAISLFQQLYMSICKVDKFDMSELLHAQIAAGEKSVTTKQTAKWRELLGFANNDSKVKNYFTSCQGEFSDYRTMLESSQFLTAFDQFLESYGHRGVYESDLSYPTYREQPEQLLIQVSSILQHDAKYDIESQSVKKERAEKLWNQYCKALPSLTGSMKRRLAKRWINKLGELYRIREFYRSELMRVTAISREIHLILQKRCLKYGWLEENGDYFMLRFDEIVKLFSEKTPDKLRGVVEKRKKLYREWGAFSMPAYMRKSLREEKGISKESMHKDEIGKLLFGNCVSTGKISAEVSVIRNPGEFYLMKPGTILVAPATGPAWTPLFAIASGIVVEIGGTLSHASIVAREYGLPALANVSSATTRLESGDRVSLDATQGILEIL